MNVQQSDDSCGEIHKKKEKEKKVNCTISAFKLISILFYIFVLLNLDYSGTDRRSNISKATLCISEIDSTCFRQILKNKIKKNYLAS